MNPRKVQRAAMSHFNLSRMIQLIEAAQVSQAHILRVGQNHIYTVYIQLFWQRNYQIYAHIRCGYTVLANPTYTA
jgi:hypothetical protein